MLVLMSKKCSKFEKMIYLKICILFNTFLIASTELKEDRYVLREDTYFEMNCGHNLEKLTSIMWKYFSTYERRSEVIYDSLQSDTLKSGFEVSCRHHEAFISTCILKLVQAKKEDSGIYVCYAEKFGSNLLNPITEIELVIRGPTYKTMVVNMGASVILPCEHNIKNLTRARWYCIIPGKEISNIICNPHQLSCNIQILKAHKESAGRYVCMVGDSLEFEQRYGLDQMTFFIDIELVVGELECNENMNEDLILLGENDCYGIEADVLNLKCSFNYFGNINYDILHLRWNKYKHGYIFENKLKSLINHEVKDEMKTISIQTNLSVAFEMRDSRFECVLDDTDIKPCQLYKFRTQHVINSTRKSPTISSDVLHNVKCSAARSENVKCSHYWVHEVVEAILENPYALLPVEQVVSPILYTCFAKCDVGKHKECIIKVVEIEVVHKSKFSGFAIGFIVGLLLDVAILATINITFKKFEKEIREIFNIQLQEKDNRNYMSQQEPLLKKDDDDAKEQLREKLKPSAEEFLKKIISSQTIVDHDNNVNIRAGKRIRRETKSGQNLLEVKNILYEGSSRHHNIKIYESTKNGNVLMLNGAIWATELDSWNQKALTSIPLISHGEPKDVLVIGGGDGINVKKLLEHPEVKSIRVYEVDECITKLSRKYFPLLTPSLDDCKVKVYLGDGYEFMKRQKDALDVIIIYSTSVQDNYLDKKYYEVIRSTLKWGGVLSLIVTGTDSDDDVMEMKAMDLCDQIFPVVNYFYLPFKEHPGTLTRCLMCSLNSRTDFMYLYDMILEEECKLRGIDQEPQQVRKRQKWSENNDKE